jgi:hypothetical protein
MSLSESGGLRAVVLSLTIGTICSTPFGQIRAGERLNSVPRASCGPRDHTETVQGETTLAERFAPGPSKPYTCNLDLVGQFEGEGAGFIMGFFQNCAYYAQWPNPELQHPGVAVLDVSDSQHPQAVGYLDSAAMRDVGESLTVANATKLLLASKYMSTTETALEIYDLSADCRHPILRSVALPGLFLHTGQFAPDGRTFYGAQGSLDLKAPVSGIFALDTSDASHPRLTAKWSPPTKDWATHAVRVNEDGTRAYVALIRPEDDSENSSQVNGLAIVDISDIQARRPDPSLRLLSTLFWKDSHYAQFALPARIKGRPYLIFTDLMGAIGYKRPPAANVCNSGKPGYGFARIIDISDERNPKMVSKLMLEVQDPINCANVMHDPTTGYGALSCDVDDAQDARLLACGYFEGGLRVFDVREPAQPREVAYYKPRARRTQSRPGSVLHARTSPTTDLTADQVVVPKFRKNGQEIGLISFDNGYQVVRFSDSFIASHADLFRKQ